MRLDITLTQRGQHLGGDCPCAVPVRAESYLERLTMRRAIGWLLRRWKPCRAKNRSKAIVPRCRNALSRPARRRGERAGRAPVIFLPLAPVGDELALAWQVMTGVFAVCHTDAEGFGRFWRSSFASFYWWRFGGDIGGDYALLETGFVFERAGHILSDYFNVATPSLLGDLSRAMLPRGFVAICGKPDRAYAAPCPPAYWPRSVLGLDAQRWKC